MSNKAIRAVIESRLNTWATTRNPVLPVAYENKAFTQPAGVYIAGYLLPAETQVDDLQGSHLRYQGIYQINVFAPIGTGPGAAEAIADEIKTLFPVNQYYTLSGTSVWIIGAVTNGRADSMENRYMIPVSFQYRADTIS